MRGIWTPERTELAVSLWNAGETAPSIANKISNGERVTRNAVLGKLWRMKVGPRATVKKRKGVRLSPEEQRERKIVGQRRKRLEARQVSNTPHRLRSFARIDAERTEQIEMSRKENWRPEKLKRLAEVASDECMEPFEWGPNDANPQGPFGFCGQKIIEGGYQYCGYHYLRNTKPRNQQ